MPIELSSEQERRLRAVMDGGAYADEQQALDAALAAVEEYAVSGFEGTGAELDELLRAGLASGTPTEADGEFWNRISAKTDRILADHQRQKSRS